MTDAAFCDQLKVEGVNFKGFGVIPKYVMLDPDLSLESKTIYAYFCSFAGNGNTTFPSRYKILYDLSISKETYYKHFRQLTEQGYISVRQEKAKNCSFLNNIYTLVSNPKKFEDKPEEPSRDLIYSQIKFSGIKSTGYGMIPRAIMIDSRLPLKSKGIYAYFCSYTGPGNSAFPKKSTILFHLGIIEKTYYKFYKILTQLNYITVVQRHINGRLQVNDYYLNDTPNEIKASKKTVYAFKSDLSISSSAKQAEQPIRDEALKVNLLSEKVKNEILSSGQIPLSYINEESLMTAAVHFLTGWETFFPDGYNNSLEQKAYNLFNDALIQMCLTKRMRFKGCLVSNQQIIERIDRLADFNRSFVDFSLITDTVINNFVHALSTQDIKNPLLYMKSCIWDILLTENINTYANMEM